MVFDVTEGEEIWRRRRRRRRREADKDFGGQVLNLAGELRVDPKRRKKLMSRGSG